VRVLVSSEWMNAGKNNCTWNEPVGTYNLAVFIMWVLQQNNAKTDRTHRLDNGQNTHLEEQSTLSVVIQGEKAKTKDIFHHNRKVPREYPGKSTMIGNPTENCCRKC
jgi:hypothetical protein